MNYAHAMNYYATVENKAKGINNMDQFPGKVRGENTKWFL